jgi:DNA-binding CsgD family transcriptional regulator
MKGNENSGIATVRAPLILSLADGSSVALKLALDPNRSTHCLTFEWERNFSRPEQLAPLGLTLRQNQVVYWVLHDKTNCEISIILGISFRTVDKHLEIIFNKLGVNNRAHLISKAWEVCCDSIHLQK